mgnify:CR=1 FL=1
MSLYLNKNNDKFISYRNDDIYIDKSLLVGVTNKNIGIERKKFMCITRPRRFGKTMALSMLNAYYSTGCDSKVIFDKLQIANDESYLEHLNKHNVIWIDMASLYTNIENKDELVVELKKRILADLKEKYVNINLTNLLLSDAIIEINSKLNERFIFLIDEWDVVFREQENNKKLCDDYIMFLRGLFKSSDVSACIDLVYMTGILPIRRYSTQSTLNMFTEYNMIDSDNLASYVGFTEDEVKGLCIKYQRDFNEIKKWYNGYKLNDVLLYNPKSVVEAVLKNKCKDYWTQTSAIEAVTNYMNYDHGVLKDTIAKMLTGLEADVDPLAFDNDLTKIDSCDAALTVLIHLGYLAYNEDMESCYIPNYEIKQEFERALKKLNWQEIYNPISNSKKLYDETLKGNADFINQTLDQNHLELAGPFNKNKEDILGIIVQISYYNAKKYYNVRKEDTSTLGRADISFIPYDNTHIPMFVELKVNSTPEDAIKQIKERKYFNSLGEYHGKVLLLGISYNDKTLKHNSQIEVIEL